MPANPHEFFRLVVHAAACLEFRLPDSSLHKNNKKHLASRPNLLLYANRSATRSRKHMLQYLNTLLELKRDKKAVTALEYGLIAALIAVVKK